MSDVTGSVLSPRPPRTSLRRFVPAAALAWALLSWGGGLEAQGTDTNRVVHGDTIRVSMRGGGIPMLASFRGWDGSSMSLDVDGFDAPWSVSVYDMQRLDVYTDRTKREGFRHGMVIGGATGFFVGAAIGVVLNATGVTDDPDGRSSQLMTRGLQGAGLGLVIGAIAGGVYRGQRPGRGWIRLELPQN